MTKIDVFPTDPKELNIGDYYIFRYKHYLPVYSKTLCQITKNIFLLLKKEYPALENIDGLFLVIEKNENFIIALQKIKSEEKYLIYNILFV